MKKILLTCLLMVAVSCGESAKDKTERIHRDSVRVNDSLLKPRKEIYDAALGAIKVLLKAPSTAKFPQVTLSNDTVRMKYLADKAYIAFPYDAQNAFGAYLHGIATVKLLKTSIGWQKASSSILDINTDAPSFYYDDFDHKAADELK